jgi:hypothetical protein
VQSSFHRPQSNSVRSIVFSSTIVCSNRATTDWSFVLSKPFATRFLRCFCRRWFLSSSFLSSFEEEDEEAIPNTSNSSLLSISFVTSSDFALEEEADACEFARERFILPQQCRAPRTFRDVLHENLGSTSTSQRTEALGVIEKVRTFSPKISISIRG